VFNVFLFLYKVCSFRLKQKEKNMNRNEERKSNHEDKIYNYYYIHIHARHFNQIGKTLFLSFKGRLDWSVGYEEPCKGLLQVDDADE